MSSLIDGKNADYTVIDFFRVFAVPQVQITVVIFLAVVVKIEDIAVGQSGKVSHIVRDLLSLFFGIDF